MQDHKEQLEGLRNELDGLSLDIMRLLNERARRVQAIGRDKALTDMPLRDSRREAQLLDLLVEENDGPFDDATVRELFREIIDAGVRLVEARPKPGLRVSPAAGPPVVVRVKGHAIGAGQPVYIAGPCSIESEEQLDQVARALADMGVGFLRGGAFKPRTSPYAFQGLGLEALRMLRDAGERYGLATVTEVTSAELAPCVAEHADILQIGARNMYNYDLLRAAGATGRPVLLKRSFGATLEEWLLAAEYVAIAGSEQIVLCERGIRTFSRDTRNTLDVSIVPLAQNASRLPVIVDVSHAAGRRDILAPLTRAAFAVGAHAVMIEVHPDPDAALSDAEQQITLEDFQNLRASVAEDMADTAARLRPPTSTARPLDAHPGQRALQPETSPSR